MSDRKNCFVIMPYGKKPDNDGSEVDFDYIYQEVIQEPVERAGLKCIRCDELEEAGSIHDDMFAYIASAEVAIVDITTLNANVFYELGARHALKKSVTILLRKQGADLPFNIQGMRVIEYPDEHGGYRGVREKIQNFIENGLVGDETDSPIFPVLEKLESGKIEPDNSRRIDELKAYTSAMKGRANHKIEIRTGDIRKWKGVDVWVNSENTNMQMARLYDRNLSALIRYYGAKKDINDQIVEDTIAIELGKCMAGKESVSLGTVLATSSGFLANTHGVKRIFHIASVYGIPGEGYRSAVEIVDVCIERCLRRMDAEAAEIGGLKSIAFPMIGTGAGGGDVNKVAHILINAAVSYFRHNPESQIEKVIFMAWNTNDLEACLAAVKGQPQLQTVEA
ncbi:MAG: macro domain-containing protein [Thiolinea sp.]